MSFEWGEHVGELELRLAGANERDVLDAAARAFGELLGGDGGDEVARDVHAAGRDAALLLAGFLDELVFLAETDGFVPARLEAAAIGGGALRARVRGALGAPPHLVKAVTHHRLAFERTEGGWTATAILDV
jgi:SHS2 domain-containing protein